MILLLMGVTGSGKTTVGVLLALQLGWEFADADHFHTPANIEKMSRGIALNDSDRGPWLENIHAQMVRWESEHRSGVLACSALKRAYREQLRRGLDINFVYLRGERETISGRVEHRVGHYAKADLVSSQFDALEEPGPHEALTVDIRQSPEEIVAEIRRALALA
jgi:gluconokinase